MFHIFRTKSYTEAELRSKKSVGLKQNPYKLVFSDKFPSVRPKSFSETSSPPLPLSHLQQQFLYGKDCRVLERLLRNKLLPSKYSSVWKVPKQKLLFGLHPGYSPIRQSYCSCFHLETSNYLKTS